MTSALLIAPFFPPRRRVGALRPFRFATHLREHGISPAVVCLATPGAELTPREAERLEGIPVLELFVGPDLTRARSGSDLEHRDQPTTQRARVSSPRWRGRFGAVTHGIDRWLPVDGWLPVVAAQAPAVARFARRHGAQVIWSTADPWSSHVLAGIVARRLALPWVADFRDPWTLCRRRTLGRPRPMLASDRRVERWIVASADHLVFTAQRTTQRYCDAYGTLGTPMSTIYNGFDSSLFADPIADAKPSTTPAGGSLQLLFFGKFRALSPAGPLIELLAYLKDHHPEVAAAIRVQSMGPLDDGDCEHARAAGVLDAFTPVPSVPAERALARLREADVLLLSTAPERDEIIPAKLWDYLAAGRPILSLAPNPEVEQILANTGAGHQVYPDAPHRLERAAQLLKSAHEAKLRGEPIWPELAFRPDALPAFDAPSTTARLARILEGVAIR